MTEASVGAIVLAAGGSRRMGSPKALLQFRGQSLLRHAVQTALDSGCRPVVVVLGAVSAALQPELDGLGVTSVENPDWQNGMSTSLQVGLRAIGPVEAVLVMVCDQPLVTSELLRTILKDFRDQAAELVACEYGGTLGVPALFARNRFPELHALSGDHGAKSVLQAHSSEVVRVPFPGGAVDIDTRDEYEHLARHGTGKRA